MRSIAQSAGRRRVVAAGILVVAVLLCTIFMPAIAVAALSGCVAIIGLVTLTRRAPIPAGLQEPQFAERVASPTVAPATGPPVPLPLRT